MTTLLVALGASMGASLRYVISHLLDRGFPRGTLLVNIAGSLLLGAFSALALSGSAMALLGAGFCGGLTTYSAFAVQVHELGPGRGATYAIIALSLSLAACAGGFLLFA